MPRSGSSWDESVCRVPNETSLRTLASIRSRSIAARIARSSRSGSWGRLPRPGPSGQSSSAAVPPAAAAAERQRGDAGAEAGRAGEEAAAGGGCLSEFRGVVRHLSIPTPPGRGCKPPWGWGAALARRPTRVSWSGRSPRRRCRSGPRSGRRRCRRRRPGHAWCRAGAARARRPAGTAAAAGELAVLAAGRGRRSRRGRRRHRRH